MCVSVSVIVQSVVMIAVKVFFQCRVRETEEERRERQQRTKRNVRVSAAESTTHSWFVVMGNALIKECSESGMEMLNSGTGDSGSSILQFFMTREVDIVHVIDLITTVSLAAHRY